MGGPARHYEELTYFAGVPFRKPEVVVRTCDETHRLAEGSGHRELVDTDCAAYTRDLPDIAPEVFGKPQVAVRPGRNSPGVAAA